jgi:putative sigma-54 modulation protein
MNIRITSRKFKAKETLKDYIKEEIKSLEKYDDRILDVNVVLSFTHVKSSIKTVEIVLTLPGKTISVIESSEEFEKSVNFALVKIKKQISKIKTKRLSRKKNED